MIPPSFPKIIIRSIRRPKRGQFFSPSIYWSRKKMYDIKKQRNVASVYAAVFRPVRGKKKRHII